MQKIVILTGAGISAESGLKTFRDEDGLWENYSIEDVATIDGWIKNPDLVQTFYNERRKSVIAAEPNAAHYALAQLQEKYDVQIITQNIDDLHERAGSKSVMHLHGIITRSQSSLDATLTYPINGWEIKMDEVCAYGSPLRPHVVWFGEPVPMLEAAAARCAEADIFAVIGTKLVVYPAAGLTDFVPENVTRYIIDLDIPYIRGGNNVIKIQEPATTGVLKMVEQLMQL
ncbi:SIR2 family NAD-dependent protein deacylase [Pedobacter sp. MR2016-24]|uniref:SIR2 family NAD-dependent protein deacylase n=1 Tax=Pedobacter sp. MR2016-24 TaxID=2994466 RepID=UPI0022478884|nr:Sir2 family NAD-dependent protein deacetylase [Pedobacter sp. MR2016-24]MCX2484780.1 NAD-dependent deacylase [Pedobacter sp. MR2016-24]